MGLRQKSNDCFILKMKYKIFYTQIIKYQEEEKVGFFKPKIQIIDKKRYETVDETFRRIMDYIAANNITKYQIVPIPSTFKIEGYTPSDSRLSGTLEIQEMQFNLIYE